MLLFLASGIVLINPALMILFFTVAASICLYLTVRAEERGNLAYFGDEYLEYRKNVKKFVPRLF